MMTLTLGELTAWALRTGESPNLSGVETTQPPERILIVDSIEKQMRQGRQSCEARWRLQTMAAIGSIVARDK